jgi:hypothetical protein
LRRSRSRHRSPRRRWTSSFLGTRNFVQPAESAQQSAIRDPGVDYDFNCDPHFLSFKLRSISRFVDNPVGCVGHRSTSVNPVHVNIFAGSSLRSLEPSRRRGNVEHGDRPLALPVPFNTFKQSMDLSTLEKNVSNSSSVTAIKTTETTMYTQGAQKTSRTSLTSSWKITRGR